MHGVYGQPPAELVAVPVVARQYSPLIPGSDALEIAQMVASFFLLAPAGTIERRYVMQPAQMIRSDGSPIGDCMMVDVSAGGARLKIASGGNVPDRFVLLLSKFEQGVKRHCSVAWRGDDAIGIRFESE